MKKSITSKQIATSMSEGSKAGLLDKLASFVRPTGPENTLARTSAKAGRQVTRASQPTAAEKTKLRKQEAETRALQRKQEAEARAQRKQAQTKQKGTTTTRSLPSKKSSTPVTLASAPQKSGGFWGNLAAKVGAKDAIVLPKAEKNTPQPKSKAKRTTTASQPTAAERAQLRKQDAEAKALKRKQEAEDRAKKRKEAAEARALKRKQNRGDKLKDTQGKTTQAAPQTLEKKVTTAATPKTQQSQVSFWENLTTKLGELGQNNPAKGTAKIDVAAVSPTTQTKGNSVRQAKKSPSQSTSPAIPEEQKAMSVTSKAEKPQVSFWRNLSEKLGELGQKSTAKGTEKPEKAPALKPEAQPATQTAPKSSTQTTTTQAPHE